MALNSKQRQVGADNFADVSSMTRRQFLTAAGLAPTAAAMYWGYGKLKGEPVKAGIIGTGDQGNYAHLSQSNPDYIRFVAFSDIRPSSQKRTLKTLADMYGPEAKDVKLYVDYKEMLARPDIELIVIALPLHLHAKVAIEAMEAGKHVLCEKLMARTVDECKQMVRAADKNRKLLAIGHQRHYSYLYANALSIIKQKNVLGDIRHIRALWHRNSTSAGSPDAEKGLYDGWSLGRKIDPADEGLDPTKYGYKSIEHLVRWRIDPMTGGGLMVELGSHQLDAISLFLDKEHPASVQGCGVNSYFKDGRGVFDHVFLIYEFPKSQVIATYSAIGTNSFDNYGEQVMGTKGTLIIDRELDAFLYREPEPKKPGGKEKPGGKDVRVTWYAGEGLVPWVEKDTRITWAENRMSRPTVESGSTAAWGGSVGAENTLISRGYREQQEHLCWIIRNGELDCPQKPRCNGRVALVDAVVALTSNIAMSLGKKIEFKPEWFDPDSDSTPEKDYPVG